MTLSEPDNPLPPGEVQTPESGGTGAPEIHPPRPPAENENVPEDIRVPWGGGELLLLLGFAIGSAFFLDIILELVLSAHYHMSREQIVNLLKSNASAAVSFQTLWSGVIFLFLFLMIRQYNHSPFWSSLRWCALRPRNLAPAVVYWSCILGGIALAISVGIASHFAGEKTKLPIEQLFRTRADMIWLMVFGICIAPFFEETIFRGYLYPVFARKWGIPAGIFITGLLFGLMHAVQLWGGWVQIALLVLVGIVLTAARARTGSVVASYLIHLSYNSLLFGLYFAGTHGLRNLPRVH